MKCLEKVRYANRAEAKKSRNKWQTRNRVHLYIYVCPACSFYHLTKKPRDK